MTYVRTWQDDDGSRCERRAGVLELHDSVYLPRNAREAAGSACPTGSRRRSSTRAFRSGIGHRSRNSACRTLPRPAVTTRPCSFPSRSASATIRRRARPRSRQSFTWCGRLRPGKLRKEQHRLGREDLLRTTFEQFERHIRDQLGRTLSEGGFEPARDIEAIMVNRWPHGYTYNYNTLFEPGRLGPFEPKEWAFVVGRQTVRV